MRTLPLVLIDRLSTLFTQAYLLARSRLASHPSPIVRLANRHGEAAYDLALLRRESDVLRGQRESVSPRRRPDYRPSQRLEILQIMRLRGWSIRHAAERFVLHPNTVRTWIQAAEGRIERPGLFVAPAWNRIHGAVRWTVHQLRDLCPEPEVGTRAIAVQLVRAGIQVSRSTVQRVLREPQPKPKLSRGRFIPPGDSQADKLLRPKRVNHVWHVDLTTRRFLWMRWTIAALLDGFSRRTLALKVYRGVPNSGQMVRLIRRATAEHGRPRHLISDHGCQFRKAFSGRIKAMDINHVQGRVRCPATNAKIERFFRTFKLWLRAALLPLSTRAVQKRLDRFADWYNAHRPHQALGGRTPNEMWNGQPPTETIAYRAADQIEPIITVRRHGYREDPDLPIVDITVGHRMTTAA